MRRNENNLKRNATYISPEIAVFDVYLENSIAGGSANISPENQNGKVSESWENDTDDVRTIEW